MSMSWLRRIVLRRENAWRRLYPPHRACTSAIQPKPERPIGGWLGIFKVGLVVTPFVYAGAMVAAQFASFLEESDIFVPDDDDDD